MLTDPVYVKQSDWKIYPDFFYIGPVFCIYAHKFLLWLPLYKETYEQRSRKLV